MGAIKSLETLIGTTFGSVFGGNLMIAGIVTAVIIASAMVIFKVDRNISVIVGSLFVMLLVATGQLNIVFKILAEVGLALVLVFTLKNIFTGGGYG